MALESLMFMPCFLAGEIAVRSQLVHLESPGAEKTSSVWVPLVIHKKILGDM